jgi:hypothetical protein
MHSKKNIVLTLDYELFFGEKSGSVENSMIKPIDLIIDLLDKYNCKMTIFWDVLHYIKAKELNVKDEVIQIEGSIKKLVRYGHDVQLHIHSHWVDAKYINKHWVFPTYKHYSLQSFEKKMIMNLVSQSKDAIENITNEKVTTFRAGGWKIEPFQDLKNAFIENEIFIDSSVSFNKVQYGNIVNFDFRGYPKDDIYKFENTPKDKNEYGKFTECQIKSIKIPNYVILYSYIKKIITKESYTVLGDGRGVGMVGFNNIVRYKTLLKRLLFGSSDMLSLEFTSKTIFKYMLGNASNNSIMIGHPKCIGGDHINVLEEILKKKDIKFISMNQLMQ